MLTMTAATNVSLQAQVLDIEKVNTIHYQLDDVMELIDTTALKAKLGEVEKMYKQNPDQLNTVRLGLIYHETALNFSFLSKTSYKGFAKKSYDLLTALSLAPTTLSAYSPVIYAYRASALSLVGAETRQLKLVGQAFTLFEEAVELYSAVSYLPEFLRGSVAENLPWFFFRKRKIARFDFQSIIDKQTKNTAFANPKVMSFTYWAWANQHQSRKDRPQALAYLEKAIALDPDYQAGRQQAELLKRKLTD
jgi:tetratricopeptide (TPR) repeat protein